VSQRAALYTVAVRPRGRSGAALPLGDLDGAGTSLGAVLAGALAGLAETSPDGSRVVRALTVTPDGDDLLAILQHGQSGVAAEIVDQAGAVRLRQTPDDLQLVRCGCLFRLPPAATAGALAVHVNNGRGLKELFQQGLTARFHSRFPALTLAIDRFVEVDALGGAVDADRILKIELARNESPDERPIAASGPWLPSGVAGRVQLSVAARTAGGRIDAALIRRHLGGDAAAFAEIVDFGGIVFDEARVEALLPDGTRRVFDLAHPGAGRPVTTELSGIELDADGEPTDGSLLAALRTAIETVS
jgi:hypothetical protein